ncbi:Hypothetical predicted protein [Octopus vulgaris]|uniref:Uncharacterized protein n=1 Tax=Octopus vulgaris TaxID=6645 RepID=A0AA36BJ45_OCTVU|nr:Hypothetical predicted protein [Octopus vulgaris]
MRQLYESIGCGRVGKVDITIQQRDNSDSCAAVEIKDRTGCIDVCGSKGRQGDGLDTHGSIRLAAGAGSDITVDHGIVVADIDIGVRVFYLVI